MKRALFVLYYVPPMGGSGVQRMLKFLKYLSDYDWTATVVCPEEGAYPYTDEGLRSQFEELPIRICRVAANTPFHRVPGMAEQFSKLPDAMARQVRKLNRMVMYPDNKKGWIDPGVKQCLKVIEEEQIDVVISSAPPFSNHVIAERVAEQSNIPVILDYRDLWGESQFHQDEMGWQKKKRSRMEKTWLQKANGIVVLDHYAEKQMRPLLREDQELRVIPHGYDPEDLSGTEGATLRPDPERMDLIYSGLFYEANQPDIIFKAVRQLISKKGDPGLHLHFQGGLEHRHRRLIQELDLENMVTDHGYRPHTVASSNLLQADALWVMDGYDAALKQVKSGKLFEYFGTAKPVLGISYPGAMEELLKRYGSSYIARPDSVSSVSDALEKMTEDFRAGKMPQPDQNFIEYYDRKRLTGSLVSLMNELAGTYPKD